MSSDEITITIDHRDLALMLSAAGYAASKLAHKAPLRASRTRGAIDRVNRAATLADQQRGAA